MSSHPINQEAFDLLSNLCTGVSTAYGASMCPYFSDVVGIRDRQPTERYTPIQLETSINRHGEAVFGRRYYDYRENIDKVDLFIMGITPNIIIQLSPKEVKKYSPEYGNYHHPPQKSRVTFTTLL